jgi:hypothetical protein
MTTSIFFRLFAAALLTVWLPFGALANGKVILPVKAAIENFQENKQEKGKETKKPVKEVPQSKKQDKPREVKPDNKTGKS